MLPQYTKNPKSSKDNYRPVSVFSNVSRVSKRYLYDQRLSHFEKVLSPYQCGFRKGFKVQHCLIALIEIWIKIVDSDESFGTLMNDLSKAFDCLSEELLIAKLDAYSFDKKNR